MSAPHVLFAGIPPFPPTDLPLSLLPSPLYLPSFLRRRQFGIRLAACPSLKTRHRKACFHLFGIFPLSQKSFLQDDRSPPTGSSVSSGIGDQSHLDDAQTLSVTAGSYLRLFPLPFFLFPAGRVSPYLVELLALFFFLM